MSLPVGRDAHLPEYSSTAHVEHFGSLPVQMCYPNGTSRRLISIQYFAAASAPRSASFPSGEAAATALVSARPTDRSVCRTRRLMPLQLGRRATQLSTLNPHSPAPPAQSLTRFRAKPLKTRSAPRVK